MTDALLDDPEALLAREAALRARAGSLRMRDAAAALGVPEAALLEVRRPGGEAIRLARPEAPEGFGRLLARLPEMTNRTMIDLLVGVPLTSAVLSRGTRTLASGK